MGEEVIQKRKLSREEKLEQERKKLEQELSEGDFGTLRARVAYILNRYPKTRDSDIELQHRYWATFHPEQYRYGQSVTADDMMNLARLTHLTRMRAKIQNQFGLFLASEGVREERKRLAQAVRENIVVDGPIGMDSSAVYCDETGKDSTFLGVGGVWFANVHDSWLLQKHLKRWRESNGVKSKEFHFTKLSNGLLPFAMDFFSEAVSQATSLGFKAVFVERQGLRHNQEDTLRELHYQVVYHGIIHEKQTGRTSFPRAVTMWKDKDEGWDLLHLRRLHDDLEVAIDRRFGEDVKLGQVLPVGSQDSFVIQLADLFMASLNRVMEREADSDHVKDRMANHVLSTLGITFKNGQQFNLANQDWVSIDFISNDSNLALYS
ncbi:DUF3800 domain-containing protein [Alicyclobacillus sp. ALC3]|uniref:DUF3800 domain-containing protein n=1 Tax=Alicyclobacillus sp. ALC3 TaxID=2796143 RepID=UPI0023799D76|nr:DUF3800 domain-containing protein [Alicyclobacillus sp. ALC3]WDL99202.1 DUF3800 domain-containing protein [Alicyclobacillus sp. ALC3]